MAKVSLIAKLTAAEGKADEFESALAALIEASNEEAGLEIYSAHRGDNNMYWLFELYSDNDAFAVHGQGDAMKTAMRAIGAFMGGPPEVSVCAPVVAKGLDI